MKVTVRNLVLLLSVFTMCFTSGAELDYDVTNRSKKALKSENPWFFAQVWNENFTGLTNGATSDTGATAWTSTITQGTFEVQNGLMFFQGVNGGSNATWVSQDIDISNYTDINISYLVGDALDAEKETSDYVRGFYVLDNGSRVQFAEVTDDVPTPIVQSINGLNGSVLRIEIDFRVSYGNETYTIDDILVEGTSAGDTQSPTAPTLSSTGQTDTTADLSWSGATDNVGVTGYKVFKDSGLEATLGNVTTYSATGLTASTTYQFTVKALDAAGNESADSNSVTVTTNSGSGSGGASVWAESGSVASYDGEVAVGTTAVPTGYKMAIDGKLITEEVRVELSDTWPDYVFSEGYNLLSLKELEQYIKEKGHLPNVPSAKEIEASGIVLGEINKILLEKIEELMLYIIQQEQRITTLENK